MYIVLIIIALVVVYLTTLRDTKQTMCTKPRSVRNPAYSRGIHCDDPDSNDCTLICESPLTPVGARTGCTTGNGFESQQCGCKVLTTPTNGTRPTPCPYLPVEGECPITCDGDYKLNMNDGTLTTEGVNVKCTPHGPETVNTCVPKQTCTITTNGARAESSMCPADNVLREGDSCGITCPTTQFAFGDDTVCATNPDSSSNTGILTEQTCMDNQSCPSNQIIPPMYANLNECLKYNNPGSASVGNEKFFGDDSCEMSCSQQLGYIPDNPTNPPSLRCVGDPSVKGGVNGIVKAARGRETPTPPECVNKFQGSFTEWNNDMNKARNTSTFCKSGNDDGQDNISRDECGASCLTAFPYCSGYNYKEADAVGLNKSVCTLVKGDHHCSRNTWDNNDYDMEYPRESLKTKFYTRNARVDPETRHNTPTAKNYDRKFTIQPAIRKRVSKDCFDSGVPADILGTIPGVPDFTMCKQHCSSFDKCMSVMYADDTRQCILGKNINTWSKNTAKCVPADNTKYITDHIITEDGFTSLYGIPSTEVEWLRWLINDPTVTEFLNEKYVMDVTRQRFEYKIWTVDDITDVVDQYNAVHLIPSTIAERIRGGVDNAPWSAYTLIKYLYKLYNITLV